MSESGFVGGDFARQVAATLSEHEDRLDALTTLLAGLEQRVEGMERQMAGLERDLGRLDALLAAHTTAHATDDARRRPARPTGEGG